MIMPGVQKPQEAVLLPEGLLERVEPRPGPFLLDGRDAAAVGLDRETVHDFTAWPST